VPLIAAPQKLWLTVCAANRQHAMVRIELTGAALAAARRCAPRLPSAAVAARRLSERGTPPRPTGLPMPTPDDPDANPIFKLLEQNRVWAAEMRAKEGYIEKMRQHKPKYLWIGCSDARVPANELLGEGPGEVFVARNVANLVVNTDVNLMSVIQYAVTALKVSDIIVCGHYDCGGVRAAMRQADHNPPLENWLRNIRDVLWLHRDEVMGIPDIEERYRRLIEVNAMQQSLNVFKTGAVQRARVASRMDPSARHTLPRVHAVVYDPTVGELKRLPVDFKKELGDHEEVYKLYQLPSASPPKPA
jgi:carbonic anhydrase